MSASPERGIFCNRTLNLRGIKAIGYDMDYTLIHYHVEKWEQRAYETLRGKLLAEGWPVEDLRFDPAKISRGVIVDTANGNLVKANRFGFVKRACHGTQLMDFEAQRQAYSREVVDLSEERWVFLNTLFSLSEGCMYAQLVDLLDARKLPGTLGYSDLYKKVKSALDEAHLEGSMKAEIIANPDEFVVLEAETALALLDQKHAGKKLLLITNSEWQYTVPMMTYAFDRFLPKGTTWRDLFDIVIIGARKPDFFTTRNPCFEVANAEGLLRPSLGLMKAGTVYLGGSAMHVEKSLGLSGDEILYVGDHMFGDVRVTKNVLRWRTALVVRELEEEIRAELKFAEKEKLLEGQMKTKEALEFEACQARVELQRTRGGYGPKARSNEETLQSKISEIRQKVDAIDSKLGSLAKEASELGHPLWGPLMRAGNDKSHLARQVERYADIYMSRVSNLLYATPFVYLRSHRGSLPHDPELL